MNYTLTLKLDGFDKVDKSLDDAIDRSGILGDSFQDLGHYVKDAMAASRVHIANATKAMDWYDAAVKRASVSLSKLNSIKGLRDVSGKDLAKVISMGDFNQNTQTPFKGLREVGGADLNKVLSMGDFNKNTAPESKADKKELLVAALATLYNPFVGARMLSNAFGKGGDENGLFGKAGALGYGGIFVAVKSLALAFSGLKKIVQEVTSSYEKARSIYANALQSGMGIKFTTQRSIIASIMGVSETEVVRYGQVMGYLTRRTKDASDIISEATPRLAKVAYEFRILGTDLEALFFKMADEAAPAILLVVSALDGLVKFINDHATVFHALMAMAGMPGGMKNFVNDLTGTKEMPMINGLPPPIAMMKQMPASAWEKMGLVTMGGHSNYQRDIAMNTRDTAKGIRILIGSIKNPQGKPSWGTSPLVNNP